MKFPSIRLRRQGVGIRDGVSYEVNAVRTVKLGKGHVKEDQEQESPIPSPEELSHGPEFTHFQTIIGLRQCKKQENEILATNQRISS